MTTYLYGEPRLISRGKRGLLSGIIDHYGIVWSTAGPNNANPDDIVFELGPEGHTPVTYRQFTVHGRATFYNEVADSRENVVARLNAFFENPRNWRPFMHNCEHFARGMLTGHFRSTQVENGLTYTKVLLEAFLNTAAAYAQEAAKEEARKREAAAAEASPTPGASTETTTRPTGAQTVNEASKSEPMIFSPHVRPQQELKAKSRRPKNKS
jgi:hypothetical protein